MAPCAICLRARAVVVRISARLSMAGASADVSLAVIAVSYCGRGWSDSLVIGHIVLLTAGLAVTVRGRMLARFYRTFVKIQLLSDPALTTKTLYNLMADCDSASWAVAWATPNPVYEAALAHREKFEHFVVGTHGYVTDPDVLEELAKGPNFKVVFPAGHLFHPKVYLFRMRDECAAVVGSHNLTKSAFSANRELSTLIQGKTGEAVLQELFAFVEDAHEGAETLTSDWLFQYRGNYRRNERYRKELEKEMSEISDVSKPDKPGLQMSWGQFFGLIKAETRHSAAARLVVLEAARALFQKSAFAAMSWDDRMRIAGIRSDAQLKHDPVHWPLFGAMASNGSFRKTVENNAVQLSAALDEIPLTGDIEEEHYEGFKRLFLAAYDSTRHHGGGIGTGTRLLAMRRPDQFVGVNGGNDDGIGEFFNCNDITLDNYWERVIKQVRAAPWWLVEEPSAAYERRVWAGRAAFLDSIYYNPKPKKI